MMQSWQIVCTCAMPLYFRDVYFLINISRSKEKKIIIIISSANCIFFCVLMFYSIATHIFPNCLFIFTCMWRCFYLLKSPLILFDSHNMQFSALVLSINKQPSLTIQLRANAFLALMYLFQHWNAFPYAIHEHHWLAHLCHLLMHVFL